MFEHVSVNRQHNSELQQQFACTTCVCHSCVYSLVTVPLHCVLCGCVRDVIITTSALFSLQYSIPLFVTVLNDRFYVALHWNGFLSFSPSSFVECILSALNLSANSPLLIKRISFQRLETFERDKECPIRKSWWKCFCMHFPIKACRVSLVNLKSKVSKLGSRLICFEDCQFWSFRRNVITMAILIHFISNLSWYFMRGMAHLKLVISWHNSTATMKSSFNITKYIHMYVLLRSRNSFTKLAIQFSKLVWISNDQVENIQYSNQFTL